MTEEKKIEMPPKKRRTHLQRQRLAVIIIACIVAVLAIAFGIVYYFTSRIIYVDDDGTRYFVRQRDVKQTLFTGEVVTVEEYVLEDEDGNIMERAELSYNYFTYAGNIVHVDSETGEYYVVAKVLAEDGETTEFDPDLMGYDVLLYPEIDRSRMISIYVKNSKGEFKFLKDDKGGFYLEGHKGLKTIDSVMLATLINLTGYSKTMTRLNIDDAGNPDSEYYDSYEGFRQNGYAEYGFPSDNPDECDTYFILKAKDLNGKEILHKVLIGDPILSGVGYYIRYGRYNEAEGKYEWRKNVYVLREMETTESYTTLSAALLGAMEDYVTPMVTTPISFNNYYDMENFSISKFDPEKNEYDEVIGFTFIPMQLRDGKFTANYPYELSLKNGDLNGYNVNDYRVDDCLQHIQSMVPLRTVKLYSEYPTEDDPDVSLRRFLKEYCHDIGCKKDENCTCRLMAAYAIGFDFVSARDAETQQPTNADAVYNHQIWISSKTEANTYYLFNATFNMVVECSEEYLEFLSWNRFEWIEPNIVSGNIAFLEKVEIQLPSGVPTIENATKIELNLDNSKSDKPSKENNFEISSEKLSILANYGSMINAGINVYQFRLFYQTLLVSSLQGMMPDDAAAQQTIADCKASGDAGADLIIKMTYRADGEIIERVYRFYFSTNGELGAYVSLNGTGEFYMMQSRVNKIVNDIAKIFTPKDVINPEAKF